MKNFNRKTILKENNRKRIEAQEEGDEHDEYDDRWDDVYDQLFSQKQDIKARRAERRENKVYDKKG